MRKGRFAHSALVLASVLTVLGSLGLHAEPAITGPSQAPGWGARGDVSPTGPDECPICLAHRSFSLTSLSAVVLEPQSSVPALLCAFVSAPLSSAPLPHEGRAPPSF